MALDGTLWPEHVRINRGDKVFSNALSSNLIGNTNIAITIHATDTSETEMRRDPNYLGSMINIKFNRTGATLTIS